MKKCKSSAAFSDQAAMDGKNKRRSISQRLEDGLQSPERPLRARSPGVVRDRRALSADRPLSSGVPAAPELHHRAPQADPGQSSQDPRKSSMTKVELLRQLTRRLRPSLSSPASPPPLPAANRPDPAASLPPIPVAPPRHARQPRKKASAKKDSATSTSDLEPHQTAPADCPAANEAPDDGLGKPERRKESLFSPAASSPSSSCVSVQQPSTNSSVADLFDDEIHLNFSKMNPSKGLMVGTYQQRTIPFRSASFSQVDVGADGTYNRRPRQMSITLKPVTYSIGRDQSKYQSVSLPRRLKLGATTAAPESPAPVDPTPEASEAPKQAAESLTPVREEQAADHVKDPSAPEASDDGLQAMEVDPLTAESEEKATAKMEDVTLDLSSQYETTEVSVTAEIRLSPVPQPVGGEHDQKVRSKSFDSGMKPLPVLDLLELNNHLLRLKAAAVAGRGNAALDRLADLEVASRLGLTPAMLLPSEFPSGDERSSESTPPPAAAPPDTPAPDPNERPAWLRELLRLQAGRARESNSSLSDEGADSGSSDSNPLPKGNFLSVPSCIHSDSSPSLTVRDVKNKRSPRLDRKRRRHSSFLIVHQRPGSQSDAPSVQRRTRKSDSARSLTFPLRNSSGLVIVPSTEDDERVSFKSWFEQTAALKRPLKEGKQETPGEEDSAGQDAMTSEPVGDERTATPETSDAFVVAQVSPDAPMPVESRLEGATEVKDPIQKNSNHRLTVSLSVTLEPTTPDPEQGPPTPFRSASPSNLSSDAESVAGVGGTSVACSPSPEKAAKIPILPRRYGLKRRPLRGPYGEMLEAEMNKSEFGKLYLSAGGKKSEDLSFLRELVPRLAIREAKSISPRPSSPMTPAPGVETGPASGSKAGNPTATTSRQNSLLSPPKSHSLDDSQLKIGYSNPAGSATGSPGTSLAPPAGLVKRKISTNSIPAIFAENKFETANHRLSSPSSIDTTKQTVPAPTHQRTSSSPCQLIQFSTTEGGFTSEDEPELLELTSICPLTVEPPSVPATATATQHPTTPPASELADESATVKEKPVVRVASIKRIRDTRTHAIGELYDTEVSYVESLQTLVTKYLQPLKSPDNAGLVESNLVDEMFYQIPAILAHHEVFLGELRKRLEAWDPKQCVGGVFLETLIKPPVIETYTAFINHWKHAKEAVKSACLAKTAFSKFLETMAREHKGKLALDSLLIMPVQRIPRYELLIKMILKHTIREHPDYELLIEAQREVHELALKINCMEREAYGAEQQQATLRELESLVEGLGPGHLAAPERAFIRHDCVTIPSALGTRKERGLFLFSDLLVITSVKRRSNAIRKSSSYATSGIASTLEANKFKLLMRVPLDDLEVSKSKEENFRRSTKDLEHLEEDLMTLNQITELMNTLHTSHPSLDDAIKELTQQIQRQINEKQNALDPQLATIDLAISTQEGTETLSVSFSSSEKRSSWEESFTDTKLRLRAMSPDRRPPPEFLSPLPIRKTRAGLQFTCAAPTSHRNPQHLHDVWVCNSDGYVGQVCILSLHPDPNVASCNGVCNARITCIAAIPAALSTSESGMKGYIAKKDLKSECAPQSGGPTKSNETQASAAATFDLESSESSSDTSDDEETGDEDSVASNKSPANLLADESSTSVSDEVDTTSQATMWLGTEDGCIHVYHCAENIRLKKNRIRIQHGSSVLCLLYLENRVFASLANGEVVVYTRETSGTWSLSEPQTIAVGTIMEPVTRMLPVNNALWCATQNCVKIVNVSTLAIEDEFAVSSDSQKSVLSMASNGLGVWVAMQGSAVVRLFHGLTHECICDVNLAPAVNKMLAGCDDIIRQHKAACLRVTSMLVCRDLLWVGTSAGVILTIPIPHLTTTSSRLPAPPTVTGISHGHTGHVRFLTCVEATPEVHFVSRSHHHPTHHRFSLKDKETLVDVISSSASNGNRLLVISGGDGYEDFRHTGLPDSVGREDSTNHLLIWQVS